MVAAQSTPGHGNVTNAHFSDLENTTELILGRSQERNMFIYDVGVFFLGMKIASVISSIRNDKNRSFKSCQLLKEQSGRVSWTE